MATSLEEELGAQGARLNSLEVMVNTILANLSQTLRLVAERQPPEGAPAEPPTRPVPVSTRIGDGVAMSFTIRFPDPYGHVCFVCVPDAASPTAIRCYAEVAKVGGDRDKLMLIPMDADEYEDYQDLLQMIEREGGM